jgi:hypothetical protein
VDYLLEAVTRRELFQWLRLEPDAFWHGLLWRDGFNHLGIAAAVPAALREALTQQPGALTQVRNSAVPNDLCHSRDCFCGSRQCSCSACCMSEVA